MITYNIEDFIKYIEKKKPILSIDYGYKRIGIAMSDQQQLMAFPLKVVKSKKELYSTIKNNYVSGIVIGMPLDLQGRKTKLCNDITLIAQHIEQEVSPNIPIILKDERFTSKLADNILKNYGCSVTDRREREDMVCACIILQEILDKMVKN